MSMHETSAGKFGLLSNQGISGPFRLKNKTQGPSHIHIPKGKLLLLPRSSSLGRWPVCVATWSLRVGHRAKPSRWRRNHSFIHLTNIYLAPPVCQAPWDPEVNQPEAQKQREWAGRGRQDTVGAWLLRWAWLRAAPAGRKQETRYVQVQKPGFTFKRIFPVFSNISNEFQIFKFPGDQMKPI